VLEKRLAKEMGKKSLSTVSSKGVFNLDDKLAKLEKEAQKTPFGSPEWNKYLETLENDRLAKKKK